MLSRAAGYYANNIGMEAKLAAYRSRKRRETMVEGAKDALRVFTSWTERAADANDNGSVKDEVISAGNKGASNLVIRL